jgi:hypothetical protein
VNSRRKCFGGQVEGAVNCTNRIKFGSALVSFFGDENPRLKVMESVKKKIDPHLKGSFNLPTCLLCQSIAKINI